MLTTLEQRQSVRFNHQTNMIYNQTVSDLPSETWNQPFQTQTSLRGTSAWQEELRATRSPSGLIMSDSSLEINYWMMNTFCRLSTSKVKGWACSPSFLIRRSWRRVRLFFSSGSGGNACTFATNRSFLKVNPRTSRSSRPYRNAQVRVTNTDRTQKHNTTSC